jgi:hypothetical protein
MMVSQDRCQALGLALLLSAGVGHAEGVEAVLGLQSDKLQRGFSNSGGDPVASLDTRWRGDTGWLAQGGLSTLGRDRRRGDAELTLGGGYGGVLDEAWAWQATGTHYRVLGSGTQRRLPYTELALALDAPGRIDLLLAASADYPGTLPTGGSGRGGAQIVEGGWHPRLAPGWVLDFGLGYVRYTRITFANHGYGSVGLSWRSGRLGISATRVFRDGPGPPLDPRAVLAMSWQL